jgi:hypothetical protein
MPEIKPIVPRIEEGIDQIDNNLSDFKQLIITLSESNDKLAHEAANSARITEYFTKWIFWLTVVMTICTIINVVAFFFKP